MLFKDYKKNVYHILWRKASLIKLWWMLVSVVLIKASNYSLRKILLVICISYINYLSPSHLSDKWYLPSAKNKWFDAQITMIIVDFFFSLINRIKHTDINNSLLFPKIKLILIYKINLKWKVVTVLTNHPEFFIIRY